MNMRRAFGREFKVAAVKRVVEKGLSVAEMARDLEVRDTMIRNLKKALQALGTLPVQDDQSDSGGDELQRLREEKRQFKMERDTLKKTMALIAKENN